MLKSLGKKVREPKGQKNSKKRIKSRFSDEDFQPFSKRQILDCSKLKESADDNFNLDESGRKLLEWVENTAGK